MVKYAHAPSATLTRDYEEGVEKILRAAGKPQSGKFKKLAREVGADESERAFKDKLKRISKAGPQQPPAPKNKDSS